MGATTQTPPVEPTTTQRHGGSNGRGPRLLVAVFAAIAVVLAGVLVFGQVAGDDDPSVPDGVQEVLDEFLVAMENNDLATMQELVTDDFRRPEYIGDPFGGPPYRSVMTIDDFDFLERESSAFVIERVGDPIVRGEGPWYVALAENWRRDDLGIQYEAIYTYAVIVDTDGELRIDDAYWVGHQVSTNSE